jgi:hypothetical protein
MTKLGNVLIATVNNQNLSIEQQKLNFSKRQKKKKSKNLL